MRAAEGRAKIGAGAAARLGATDDMRVWIGALLLIAVTSLGCASAAERARAARDKGRTDEAIRLYQEALAEGPTADVAGELAQLHLEQGQVRLALATLQGAGDGGDPAMWARLGLRLAEAGELAAAESCYQKALAGDGGNALARAGLTIVQGQLAHRRRIEAVRATAAADLAALRGAFRPGVGEGPAGGGVQGSPVRFRPYLTPGLEISYSRSGETRGMVAAFVTDYDRLELDLRERGALGVRRDGDGLAVRETVASIDLRRGREPRFRFEPAAGQEPVLEYAVSSEGAVRVTGGADALATALEVAARQQSVAVDPLLKVDAEGLQRRLLGWIDGAPAFEGGRHAGEADGVERRPGDRWFGLAVLRTGAGPTPVHYEAELVGWATFRGVPVARVSYDFFGHARHRFRGDAPEAQALFDLKKALGGGLGRWGEPDEPFSGKGTRLVEPRTMWVLSEQVLVRGWMSLPNRGGGRRVEYVHEGRYEVEGLAVPAEGAPGEPGPAVAASPP
ncbi:tetratricopeptide repeat protein [Myxococcota bacterium]|nr:tetratricopeptide repeat protein [Myxococcota bacterium]